MGRLAASRAVFHSEADFQHAFGQVLHALDPELGVRLEVPQDGVGRLDLLCRNTDDTCRTAIEFKYFTTRWRGVDPLTTEVFNLRDHAATDLARRAFVFDIARLERMRQLGLVTDGIAIMLTNHPGLWSPPTSSRTTRDHEFRIHQDRELTGTLRWAGGAYPANQRDLTGSYLLRWQDYSALPNPNGQFRWVAATVA